MQLPVLSVDEYRLPGRFRPPKIPKSMSLQSSVVFRVPLDLSPNGNRQRSEQAGLV
jgi:hypothetical protein